MIFMKPLKMNLQDRHFKMDTPSVTQMMPKCLILRFKIMFNDCDGHHKEA